MARQSRRAQVIDRVDEARSPGNADRVAVGSAGSIEPPDADVIGDLSRMPRDALAGTGLRPCAHPSRPVRMPPAPQRQHHPTWPQSIWLDRPAPETPPPELRRSVVRRQAGELIDPPVVTDQRIQHTHHHLDIERARSVHRRDVDPVLRAIEQRLEDDEILR